MDQKKPSRWLIALRYSPIILSLIEEILLEVRGESKKEQFPAPDAVKQLSDIPPPLDERQ